MSALFLKLLNMSINAGWLVLAVVVIRMLTRKAPKYLHCVLWALVALRLVMPFSLPSPTSVLPTAEPVPPAVVYRAERAVPAPTLQTVPTVPNAPATVTPAPQTEPEMPATATPAPASPLDIAAVVWLSGCGLMALYALASYLRLRYRVRAALLLRERVWLCDEIDTPFILGIVRPRIYLPSAMDGDSMAHVCAHEEAHLKRLDHLWKPLGFLLLAVHWFNPLVWLAYILLCRDIELACDERVIRSMDAEAIRAYSRTLLACSAPRRLVSACPLAFGETGAKARIKAVLNYKKPAFWIILVAVVACVAAAVCFLTDPKQDEPDLSLLNYKQLASVAYQTDGLDVETDGLNGRDRIAGPVIGRFLDGAEWTRQTEDIRPDGGADIRIAVGGNDLWLYSALPDLAVITDDTGGVRCYAAPGVYDAAYALLLANAYRSVPLETPLPETALTKYLKTLTADDVEPWRAPLNPAVTNETLVAALNGAADKRVDEPNMTMNGSWYDIVWSVDLDIKGADDGEPAGSLHLFAGYRENLVEVFGSGSLPSGRAVLEDETLYRLVRTAYDSPAGTIDPDYALYRDAVEKRLQESVTGEIVGYEVRGFAKVAENARLHAVVYLLDAVFFADKPENIVLAGGAYVDSEFTIHGRIWDPFLVVVDGRAAGFVSWESVGDGGVYLDRYATADDLAAAAAGELRPTLDQFADETKINVALRPTERTDIDGYGYYAPADQAAWRAAWDKAYAKRVVLSGTPKVLDPANSTGILIKDGDTYMFMMQDGSLVIYGSPDNYRIPARDAAELTALARGVADDFGIAPVEPARLKGITRLTLDLRGGRTYVLEDAASVAKAEAILTSAKPYGGMSGCWFTSLVYVELADGRTEVISVATDSCGCYLSDGLCYDWRGDNSEFYALFGLDDITAFLLGE